MLNEKEVLELLKTSLTKYIAKLENNSLYYIEFGAESIAYMKVLNDKELKCDFLTLDRAKVFLENIKERL